MKAVIRLICGVGLLLAAARETRRAPAGAFHSRCLERHFWFSIRPSFVSSSVRLYVEDQRRLYLLSDPEAARCGYTVRIGGAGDLVLRASFLACHVRTDTGSGYRLSLRLVDQGAAFPVRLRCSVPGDGWSSREVVCEEKYMEVSVREPNLPVALQPDPEAAAPVAVMLHGAAKALSLTEAAALGYHVSLRPRLTLRCLYSSPFAYFIKEQGVDVEIVRATILYRLQSRISAVDATLACALNEAAAEGSDLVWTVPRSLSPLVHGQFKVRGVRLGVNGQTLSASDTKERGYKVDLRDGRVEARIPTGALGGHAKSGLVRGRYSRSVTVDLFFMSQWEDKRWPLTQLRSFRLLKTPLIPQTLVFTHSTAASDELFSVTLGFFAADVSLQKLTIDGGGDLLTWSQSLQPQSDADLVVSRLAHRNGSVSYQLGFPLSHPKIIPKYIGGGFRKYRLTFTFTLSISGSGDVFHHQATLEHSVAYTAPLSPRLEGKCTDSSLLVLLLHGAQAEQQWELFLGARKLDWNLVEMTGSQLEAEDDYLTVAIPLSSPGLNFEELTLQGLVAGVEVTVVDAESLEVQDRLSHKCTFPARELLVCLPEGKVVALVDTTHSSPPVSPNRTTLLDPGCVPMETDSARALFSFSVNSCGTTVTTEGNLLVYENQISYVQGFLPLNGPVIHRDSPYRLTLQCRYPTNHSSTHQIQHVLHQPLDDRVEAVNSGGRGSS